MNPIDDVLRDLDDPGHVCDLDLAAAIEVLRTAKRALGGSHRYLMTTSFLEQDLMKLESIASARLSFKDPLRPQCHADGKRCVNRFRLSAALRWGG